MDNNCQLVVFSDKAYNAIIRETFEWDPVETGGILLGHVLDNGCWIVMEVLPPGYGEGREGDNVYHEMAYFEYNRKFVNYLAKSVAEQYEIPLELLGLWHRHPGGMDHFSGTDDGTNSSFAAQNPHGVISGLINVDPQLRMTMYYLAHSDARTYGRPNYQRVDVEVGSDLIPEEYFKLRYYQGEERDLHPYAPQRTNRPVRVHQQIHTAPIQEQQTSQEKASDEHIDGNSIVIEQLGRNSRGTQKQETTHTTKDETTLSVAEDIIEKIKKNKTVVILVLALIAFLFSISSIKNDFSKGFRFLGNDDKAGATVVTEETNIDAQIENLTDDSEKNEKSETDTEAKDVQDNTKTTEPVPVSDKFENGKSANNAVEEKQTAEIHKDQK
mgnify:CR=1 FL=1